MNTKIFKDLIESSEYPAFIKKRANNWLDNAEKLTNDLHDLILILEQLTRRKVEEIIIKCDEFIIFSIRDKNEFDKEYPYRVVYKKSNKWVNSSFVSESVDIALLTYLSQKYLGGNSQFALFASRMLGIETK